MRARFEAMSLYIHSRQSAPDLRTRQDGERTPLRL